MSVGSQRIVLRGENTLYSAHQRTALARQVRINLFLERSLEQVTGTHAYAKRDDAVPGAAGSILKYGVAGIKPASLQEHAAQRRAGTLRRDKYHIDIGRRNDTRAFLVRDTETVREIKRLARREVSF